MCMHQSTLLVGLNRFLIHDSSLSAGDGDDDDHDDDDDDDDIDDDDDDIDVDELPEGQVGLGDSG